MSDFGERNQRDFDELLAYAERVAGDLKWSHERASDYHAALQELRRVVSLGR
jgi:hypothetical protein